MTAAIISVVIPAFQARDFIARAARSVVEQTRSDWELVIVSDDGEDYGALLRAQGLTDARFRCVFTPGIGTGPAMARNVGLDAAAGRFVAALDADDRLEPRALEILVPLAHQHGASYSHRRIVEHETDQEIVSFDRQLATGLVSLEDVLTSQIHTYAGIVLDRSRVGARWPSSSERWEDSHVYVKCFDDIDRMAHSAEPLYVYYKRDGSICNRPETAKEYLDAALALLGRLENGDPLEIRSDAGRALYERFLRGWVAAEQAFLRELAAGQCTDYRDFLSRHLDMFFRLGWQPRPTTPLPAQMESHQ